MHNWGKEWTQYLSPAWLTKTRFNEHLVPEICIGTRTYVHVWVNGGWQLLFGPRV